MKFNLIEISLTELRDFIANVDKDGKLGLSELSLVSLKLRIQFLIFKKNFKSFPAFFAFFNEDKDYREFVCKSIFAKSNELFRDAECWDELKPSLINKKNINPLQICVFERGNYSDTITLLICLQNWGLLFNCEITVVDLNFNNEMPKITLFDQKEMENGILNYSGLKDNKDFTNFFTKKDKDYEYHLPENILIKNVTLNEFSELETGYDILIARNITLNYNFVSHEKMFEIYLKHLNSKGILFTGNKEGFKWCSKFSIITFDKKSIPIYYKK